MDSQRFNLGEDLTKKDINFPTNKFSLSKLTLFQSTFQLFCFRFALCLRFYLIFWESKWSPFPRYVTFLSSSALCSSVPCWKNFWGWILPWNTFHLICPKKIAEWFGAVSRALIKSFLAYYHYVVYYLNNIVSEHISHEGKARRLQFLMMIISQVMFWGREARRKKIMRQLEKSNNKDLKTWNTASLSWTGADSSFCWMNLKQCLNKLWPRRCGGWWLWRCWRNWEMRKWVSSAESRSRGSDKLG